MKLLHAWSLAGLVLGLGVHVGCVSSGTGSASTTPNLNQRAADASNRSGGASGSAETSAADSTVRMADDSDGRALASAPTDSQAVVRVTLVDLPLDKSLEAAWSVVDEDVFEALTRGVWASNGLRIGLLRKDRLGAFLSALPANLGDRRQVMYTGDGPIVLTRSRPLRAPFFADLTVPPFAPRREAVVGHVLQMLMELRPQQGGFTRVTLTPQHHKPRPTLRPRTAQEKLLDGRLFEELLLTVTVPEGREARYLVLGLARNERTLPVSERGMLERMEQADEEVWVDPGGDAAEGGASSEGWQVRAENLVEPALGEAEAEGDDERPPGQGMGDRVVDERVEPLPLNLGRALMTTGVRGSEAQVLMLMEIKGLR